jgi:hypothetical protein
MHDIDFLPADYVCVQTTRKNNNWLRGLFVAVLALMAVGWVAQQRSIQELAARRHRTQQQASAMLSKLESEDQLRLELKQLENGRRLLDGLRAQVPATRWLVAIVNALPTQSSIAEIHSEIDEGTEPNLPLEQNGQAKPGSAPAPDSIQQDLDRMTKLTPRRTVVISVRGSAADDLEVSRFLTALNQTGLFERVQLLFTDQDSRQERTLRTFAIRLRTRPLGKPQRTSAQPVALGNVPSARN